MKWQIIYLDIFIYIFTCTCTLRKVIFNCFLLQQGIAIDCLCQNIIAYHLLFNFILSLDRFTLSQVTIFVTFSQFSSQILIFFSEVNCLSHDRTKSLLTIFHYEKLFFKISIQKFWEHTTLFSWALLKAVCACCRQANR